MSRIILLTCLLIGLASFLVGECHMLMYRNDTDPLISNYPPSGSRGHIQPPVDVHGDVDTILARPLFCKTRRPPPVVESAPMPLPRLTGVLVSSYGKTVVFAGGSNGKSVALGENDVIGAYIIKSIGADQVTISGPDGTRVLHPIFAVDPNGSPEAQVDADRGALLPPRQIYKGPALHSSR